MPFHDLYRRQVALLVRMLPSIADEDCFALKGGTAINLFHRDMPRLSVDIDLTYLPIAPRRDSLAEIDAAMKRIARAAKSTSPAMEITASKSGTNSDTVTKLIAREHNVQIKIEVTPVLRGCVYEPDVCTVSPAVEDAFGFAEIQVVSFADLYGGKIVAALDRQHPRDLFDIRDLLVHEGLDDKLRRAFIVYLISHNRPMFEVLQCRPKDIRQEYERGFQGMTDRPVTLDDLIVARDALISAIIGQMPEDHRRFLISFESGEPRWSLLDVEHADKLPAVLWRQRNLETLSNTKRSRLIQGLERVLA